MERQMRVYYYIDSETYIDNEGFRRMKTAVKPAAMELDSSKDTPINGRFTLYPFRHKSGLLYDGLRLEAFRGTTWQTIPKEYRDLDVQARSEALIALHVTGFDKIPGLDMSLPESDRLLKGVEDGILAIDGWESSIQVDIKRDNQYKLRVESSLKQIRLAPANLYVARETAEAVAESWKIKWDIQREAQADVDWREDVLALCVKNDLLPQVHYVTDFMCSLPHDSRSRMRYYEGEWLYQLTSKDDWRVVMTRDTDTGKLVSCLNQ